MTVWLSAPAACFAMATAGGWSGHAPPHSHGHEESKAFEVSAKPGVAHGHLTAGAGNGADDPRQACPHCMPTGGSAAGHSHAFCETQDQLTSAGLGGAVKADAKPPMDAVPPVHAGDVRWPLPIPAARSPDRPTASPPVPLILRYCVLLN
jgi:hypothetical protein